MAAALHIRVSRLRVALWCVLAALLWAAGCSPSASHPVAPAAEHVASEPVESEATRRLGEMSDAELAERLKADASAFGSASLGLPHAGALEGAVPMPQGAAWNVVAPEQAFGTRETVEAIARAINAVQQQFPEGAPLHVGHLSKKRGGRLWPHRSHQSGRDVDLGYYYLPGKPSGWYQRASAWNLDCERTWALLRALITKTDVEIVFVGIRLQKLLKAHALSIGEDPAWLDTIFQWRSRHASTLVRHTWGHDTHMHVRFHNPYAQTLGYRAHNALVGKRWRGVARTREPVIPARRLPPGPGSSNTREIAAGAP